VTDLRLVGVDLSLTSTGLAIGEVCSDGVQVRTRRVTSKFFGVERLFDLREQLRPLVGDAFLVVIEGYAFNVGTRGKKDERVGIPSHAHALGEVGGVVRLDLFDHGRLYVDVPPAVLKRYATGAGNASKDRVYGEAIRRLNYTGSSKDEADALWLLAMGLEYVGRPLVRLPSHNRGALTSVTWPAGLLPSEPEEATGR
jgi:Holliday junction resolvasome RuvABC endonuclease subunit